MSAARFSAPGGGTHDVAPGGALVLPADVLGLGPHVLSRGTPLRIDGRRLDRAGAARRVRAGLYVIDGHTPVAAEVTVAGHLDAVRRGASDLLEEAPLLRGRGADPAGVLSGGERRVLAWLVGVVRAPRFAVLDGAGAGLDADTLAWCGRVVATWRDAGTAVALRPGRPEERAWVER